MTTKEIEAYLSQPVSFFCPKGYMGCLDCGKYFHHQIVYCPKCGQKIIRHKDIPFKDFILATRDCGSGPMNTLYCYLIYNRDGRKEFSWDLSKESKQIYDYADKHYA